MAHEERYSAVIELNSKQAQAEVKRLEQDLAELEKKRKEAMGVRSKESKKIAQDLQKEIDITKKKIQEEKKHVQGLSAAVGKLSEQSYKDLQQQLKRLYALMRDGTVKKGTKEWQALAERVKDCKREMKEYNDAVNTQNGAWQRFTKFLNDSWGGLSLVLGSITGLSMTIRKVTSDFAAMQQEMANVRKYTGQSMEEVERMNEDFKRMDTRTAREQMNRLAGSAGRLGITATKSVEEFVDAADKIGVALGDDLGEGAVDKIGKLAMAFGEDEKKGLRGAMLATGSAVNELAQNSSAQAGYLVDFTARVAGFGKQIGLTQAQIMGFGAVMDENLLRDEMASTAFGNMLTKMQKDTAKFARIAGKSVEEFTKTLREDANQAIIELAESLRSQDPQTMMKMLDDMGLDGSRAVGVLATLADKIDDVKERQKLATKAYAEGTSVLEEFNIQNNTVQAGIEKAKKRFHDLSIELGEKLQPIVMYTISTTSMMVKSLSAIIEFSIKYRGLLLSLASVILVYNAGKIKKIALEKLDILWTKAATLADEAAIWTKTLLRNALVALEATWAFLTKGVKGYTAVMEAARAASLTNPWTALATVLTVVGVAIYGLVKAWQSHMKALQEQDPAYRIHKKHMQDMADISKKVNEDIAKEMSTIHHLTNVIRSNAYSINERRKAIQELQKIIPEYHGSITNEGKLINDNKKAIDEYVKSLITAAKAQAYMDKLTEIEQEKLDAKLKLERKKNNVKAVQAELDRGESMGDKNPYKSKPETVYRPGNGMGIEGSYDTFEGNDKRIKKLKELKDQQDAVNEALNDYNVALGREREIERAMKKEGIMMPVEVTGTRTPTVKTPVEYETKEEKEKREKEEKEQQKLLKKRAETVKAEYQAEIAAEMESYMKGKENYEAYMERKHRITLSYYDKMKEVYGEDSDEYKKLLDDRAREEQRYNEERAEFSAKTLEYDHLEKERSIRRQYMQKQVTDNRGLDEALFQEDIDYMRKKQKLYEKDPKKWAEMEMSIQQKLKDRQLKLEESYLQQLQKFREETGRMDYDKLEKIELQGAEDFYGALRAQGQLTREEYNAILQHIRRKYAELRGEMAANTDVQAKAAEALETAKQNAKAKDNDAGDNIATGLFAIGNAVDQQQKINEQLKALYGEDYENNREYQEAKRQLNLETMQEVVAGVEAAYNTINSIMSAASSYAQACSDLEVKKIEQDYDRQIAAAGKNEKKKQKLEEQKEKAVAKAKTAANEKAMKIEVAQAIASTAMAAINAYSSAAQVPVVGYLLAPIAAAAAVAAGQLQIATIKKQHEAEASGYYEGGFTGGNRYRKEAGVVHEGEFVANHQAVNNRELTPLFQLLDQAQRNNRVGTLRAEDVTNVMGGPAGAGSVTPIVNVVTGNEGLDGSISTLNEAIDTLNALLTDGIHSTVVLDGPNGLDAQYNKYKKLKA